MKEVLVVGVISSARKESNSAAMVRAALRGAEQGGAQVREVFLPTLQLGFCTGCLRCMKEGKCPQNDGFNEVRELLNNADGIILGAPTYAAAPNAIMKNLIDRLGMYEVSTSSLGGKYIAGISCANSVGAAKKVAKALSRFGINGTFLRSYSCGYLGEGFSKGRTAATDSNVLEKADHLGRRMAADILKGRKYPLQNLLGRMVAGLFMKPIFTSYIMGNKDADAKVIYESLRARNLIVG